MIHVSTDEVYGEVGVGEKARAEGQALRPSNPYSASKAAGDMMVTGCVV